MSDEYIAKPIKNRRALVQDAKLKILRKVEQGRKHYERARRIDRKEEVHSKELSEQIARTEFSWDIGSPFPARTILKRYAVRPDGLLYIVFDHAGNPLSPEIPAGDTRFPLLGEPSDLLAFTRIADEEQYLRHAFVNMPDAVKSGKMYSDLVPFSVVRAAYFLQTGEVLFGMDNRLVPTACREVPFRDRIVMRPLVYIDTLKHAEWDKEKAEIKKAGHKITKPAKYENLERGPLTRISDGEIRGRYYYDHKKHDLVYVRNINKRQREGARAWVYDRPYYEFGIDRWYPSVRLTDKFGNKEIIDAAVICLFLVKGIKVLKVYRKDGVPDNNLSIDNLSTAPFYDE